MSTLLSTDLPCSFSELVFKPVCTLKTINDWVNVDDSLGCLTAIRAKELTDKLCELPQIKGLPHLTIHINLGDKAFTMDNFLTLVLLAESLPQLTLFFYLSPQNLSHLLSLTAAFHAMEQVIIYYQHCHRFTSDPSFMQKVCFLTDKRQKLLSQKQFTFEEPADESDNHSMANLGNIINYAWSCLKAGACELSCQFLKTLLAQNQANSQFHEEIFVQLQVIRFLSHQHQLIVNESFPEAFHFVSKEQVAHLYFIKAFSATLLRNLPMAQQCFEKANIHPNMPLSDEDSVYKLNLYALFLLLNGECNAAFNLEMRLLDYIQTHFVDAVALHHVIYINIARLYKKLGQFDLAADYYEQAYGQLRGGGFTLFDKMSYAMDKAILDEQCGRAKDALFAWLQVAVYWLACDNPYALALRQRLVLCQEKAGDIAKYLSKEKINRFLLEKITQLALASDIPLQDQGRLAGNSASTIHLDTTDTILRFVSTKNKEIKKQICYATNNLILYSCPTPSASPTHPITGVELGLHRLISNLIRKTMGVTEEQQLIAIETEHDSFYPQSRDECIALALIAQCDACFYEGTMITITPAMLDRFLNNVKISLVHMIQSIETTAAGLRVFYKRSFLNQCLDSPAEIELVNVLCHEKDSPLNFAKNYSLDPLISLLNKKVILFHLSAFYD